MKIQGESGEGAGMWRMPFYGGRGMAVLTGERERMVQIGRDGGCGVCLRFPLAGVNFLCEVETKSCAQSHGEEAGPEV